jgi:hypothetical protein
MWAPNFLPGPGFSQGTGRKTHKLLGLDPVKRHLGGRNFRPRSDFTCEPSQPPRIRSHHAQRQSLLRHHPQRQHHNTTTMADNDSPVTLRTRKFIRNPLLGRKQMVV